MEDFKLYVDVQRVEAHVVADMNAGAQREVRFVTFGPFSTRARAEDCLIVLSGRPDVLCAHLRNPATGGT